MSQPVHDLQRLIANQRPVSGRVVAVTSGMVRVATAQGVMEVSGDGLAVGDRVVVRNGVAVKIQGTAAQTMYFV
ncbi:hypothetical protein Mmc1_2725 [Magnetococcus marinus MC-1]|uniref:Uncharacterized protein n=1 Tax=Magnetococcus marinus (strain ATCC BAA-1437 / JCM 17883 / MC-1) TaxID=156889 RepID=A0LB75_MAGMM|nr:hypothetical protein [Magnetococcus marinus]ABK45218.1 hypothetical protein Mmc1_2725 [Magnetococcus marinus MC-1]